MDNDKNKEPEKPELEQNDEKLKFLNKIGNKLGLSHLKEDKNKRNKMIAIVVITLLSLSFVIALLIHSSAPVQKKIVNKAPVSLIAPAGLAKHNWIVNNSAKLNKQSEQLKSLESIVKKLRKNIKKQRQKKINSLVNKPVTSPFGSFPPPPPAFTSGVNPNNNNTAKPTYRQTNGLIGQVSYVVKGNDNNSPELSSPVNNLSRPKPPSATETAGRSKKKDNILPGSFAKVILLTGAEVPTNGGGSVGPVPVLMRVLSDDQLPNFFKTNIRNCFILGQATGSLSAGRAYVRAQKLSCVSKNGKTISANINATAVGEDGKVGLAGKVITKQGALLARVLIAGFLQGVGQAFQQSSQSLTFSGLTGTTSAAPITPSGRELLSVGIGGGVSQATQKLAQFYMDMANKMFPVIQINSGRKIDVMFLKGAYLP